MTNQLASIHKTDSLGKLHQYLKAQDVTKLRPLLIAEYRRLSRYQNIKEWNELVRVCEALAIVGWGKEPAVDARAEKWINGSWYTYLRNRYFEDVDAQSGEWSKSGDSFVLRNGTDQGQYGIRKFATQRNPLPRNPVRMERSASFQKSAAAFVDALKQLRRRLDRETRPELYGSDFHYVGIRCCFSDHDNVYETVRAEYFHEKAEVPKDFKGRSYIRPRLDFGKLAKKEGHLRLLVTRHFTKTEGFLSLAKQKLLFKEDLATILDTLESKLKAKKLQFNTRLLREDVERILATW
ncbi:hypothetical protein PLCT1_02592 [Planctomycetaceae bacterium]|nr:hypothetical protein PLCT1_02592 [Planctomycetaceae bacterium]